MARSKPVAKRQVAAPSSKRPVAAPAKGGRDAKPPAAKRGEPVTKKVEAPKVAAKVAAKAPAKSATKVATKAVSKPTAKVAAKAGSNGAGPKVPAKAAPKVALKAAPKPGPRTTRKRATKRPAAGRSKGRRVAPRKPEIPVVRVVKVRQLDPIAKCGPGTSVEQLFRVDEQAGSHATVHLVFFDRHGWYCVHGPRCAAVADVHSHNKTQQRARAGGR